MKKSLVIISFAFIFLLTLSVVSAGWFSDLFSERTTGEAVRITGDVFYYCKTGGSSGGCHPLASGIASGACSYLRSDCQGGLSGSVSTCERCSSVAIEIPPCTPSSCPVEQTCVDGKCQERDSDTQVVVKSAERGTFPRTAESSTSSSARTSQSSRGSECPRGWNTVSASEGGNCCRKAENRGRTTSRLFSRR